MTPLDPDAQDVMAAFTRGNPVLIADPVYQQACAAGLRQAVSLPYDVPPWFRGDDYWTYRSGVEAERERIAAIASKLEIRK